LLLFNVLFTLCTLIDFYLLIDLTLCLNFALLYSQFFVGATAFLIAIQIMLFNVIFIAIRKAVRQFGFLVFETKQQNMLHSLSLFMLLRSSVKSYSITCCRSNSVLKGGHQNDSFAP